MPIKLHDKVNLSSGEKEDAYYLDTKDVAQLNDLRLKAWDFGRIKRLNEEFIELRNLFQEKILVPEMKKYILDYITKNPNTPTRSIRPPKYELWAAFYTAFGELTKEKLIVGAKQGRGKNRLWSINKVADTLKEV